jgi:dihydrofolate reductase
LLLTRKESVPYDVEIVSSIEEVIKLSKSTDEEIFIGGGSSVYEQFIPYADRLYITHINDEYEGDTYFPKYDLNEYKLIKEAQKDNLRFCVYERTL